ALTASGVTARIEEHEVRVGGPHMVGELGLEPLAETAPWGERGRTVLHVLVDGEIVGALGLADEVRPESRQAVEELHDRDIQVVMITGDAEPVARAVAEDLGIDQVFAQVRPENKSAKVAELQQKSHGVARVATRV